LSLTPGRCLRTRVAGLFLFLPLLGRVQFNQRVSKADHPGSKMVPATTALAIGLFAGLNIPPKKSYATAYCYGTVRDRQQKLLSGWVSALAPVLFPHAKGFAALLASDPVSRRSDRTAANTICPSVAKPTKPC
jgi:hypothetical protein